MINSDNGYILRFCGDQEVKYADFLSDGEKVSMAPGLTGAIHVRLVSPFIVFVTLTVNISTKTFPILYDKFPVVHEIKAGWTEVKCRIRFLRVSLLQWVLINVAYVLSTAVAAMQTHLNYAQLVQKSMPRLDTFQQEQRIWFDLLIVLYLKRLREHGRIIERPTSWTWFREDSRRIELVKYTAPASHIFSSLSCALYRRSIRKETMIVSHLQGSKRLLKIRHSIQTVYGR